MINVDKIKHFSIEELINYIIQNDIEKENIITSIKNSTLSKVELEKLTYNTETSFKRINEPLELELKLFYTIVPFGIVNVFLDSHNDEFKRFEKFRFLKKIKQYYLYSFVGSIAYILIGILFAILF